MKYLIPISIVLLLSACSDFSGPPKPRGYPRVDFPERVATVFDTSMCAFTLRYPNYMKPERDTAYFGDKPKHPCWFTLQLPDFNGSIHITYTPVASKKDVYEVFDDAFRLVAEHNKRADGSQQFPFKNDSAKVYGLLYEIDGFVASPFQFVVTDSVKHSLRASLYFNTSPQPDSLRPIVEFVKKDMVEMLNSVRWKK